MNLLRKLLWLAIVHTSRQFEAVGFDVRVAGSVSDAHLVLARLREALSLIERYDRPTLEAARARLRWILLTDSRDGEYIASIRTCRLNRGYVELASTLSLAMMIVHEACHARIDQGGLRYLRENRGKIERECVEAEVAFAQRVPNSEDAVVKARASLSSEWWDIEKHAASTISSLQERGVPAWFARWLVNRNLKAAGRVPKSPPRL
jgi:hypothetical protein